MTTEAGTIPHVMVNGVSGERTTIQLKPREGLTVADVKAFLAERRETAKLIDPENCAASYHWVPVLDVYELLEIPAEWACAGGEWFVRNLGRPDGAPDGCWVWVGDLPDVTYERLLERRPREGVLGMEG
jgi:hypothetical protein